MKTQVRKMALSVALAVAVVGLGSLFAQPANAQWWGSGPVYHAGSVHYHRTYHPTSTHWTPSRGLHTHGHYDYRPHYIPGHFDYNHNGHMHWNRNYH